MKRQAGVAMTALLIVAMVYGISAQPAAPDASGTANPELVGSLAKEIGATPQQAEGAAGALFGVAKQKLPAGDWEKVSAAVPGMDALLKAAPALGAAGAGGAGGAAAAAAGAMGGGLGGAVAAFSKLGLKPEMVAKAVPVVTQYVTKSGGAGIGSLLAGALK